MENPHILILLNYFFYDLVEDVLIPTLLLTPLLKSIRLTLNLSRVFVLLGFPKVLPRVEVFPTQLL